MFHRRTVIALLQLLALGCQSRHSASSPGTSVPLDVVVESPTQRLTKHPERSVVLQVAPIAESELVALDRLKTEGTTPATSVVYSSPKTKWGETVLQIQPRGQDINSNASLWVALRPAATSFVVTRVGASRSHVKAGEDHVDWSTECSGTLSIDVQRYRDTGLLAGSFSIHALFPRTCTAEVGFDRVALDSSFAWHAEECAIDLPLLCLSSDFLDA